MSRNNIGSRNWLAGWLLNLSFVAFQAVGQAPGTALWQIATPGEIDSSPVLAPDGTIYVTVHDYSRYYVSLCSFSAQGATNWSLGITSSEVSSPAVGPDGTVYVGVGGDLLAKNPDGTLAWSLITYGHTMSAPAIGADGQLYVTAVNISGTSIMLFSLAPNGTTNWTRVLGRVDYGEPGGYHQPSPTIGPDGTIYAISRSRNLTAFSPDGTTNWSATLGSQTYGSPAVGTDGTIYIGTDDGNIHVLDAQGRSKWTYRTGGFVEGSPVLGNGGAMYVGSGDGNLYAFTATGDKQWVFPSGGVSGSPAIAGDGTIYVGSYANSRFYALTPGGSNLWTFTAQGRIFVSPVISPEGTIYVGAGSTLYALGGGSAPATSGWPMYRRDARHQGRSTQRGIEKPVLTEDGSFAMVFTTEVGRLYQLEYTTNLHDWFELTNFVTTGSKMQFSDPAPTGSTQRYYRLATDEN